VLSEFGFGQDAIAELREQGAIGPAYGSEGMETTNA
jgi:hypothetical protein